MPPRLEADLRQGAPSLGEREPSTAHLVLLLYRSEMGLIHIRLTTRFPVTAQVYIKGHTWPALQMLKKLLGFNLHENAFTALDDP